MPHLRLESLQGTMGDNMEGELGYLPVGMPRQGQHEENLKLAGYASWGGGAEGRRGREAQPCHGRSRLDTREATLR